MLSLLPKNIVKMYWYHLILFHRAFFRPFEIFVDVLMLLLVFFVSDMRASISSIPSEAIFFLINFCGLSYLFVFCYRMHQMIYVLLFPA